jgi:hypothetical protein
MRLIRAVKEVSTMDLQPFETVGVARGTDALLKDLGKQSVELAQRPWRKGLNGILLACTELPVIVRTNSSSLLSEFQGTLFRSTDILAMAVVGMEFDSRESDTEEIAISELNSS